jgi:hypothetical protein
MRSTNFPRNPRRPLSAVLGVGAALAAFGLVLSSAVPSSVIIGRRDALRFYEPLRAFLADELRAGRVPTWYPLDGIGTSFVGSSVGGLLNPLSWTALFLTPAQSVKWQGLILVAVAAAGMFVLCRRLGSPPAGRWLAATAYGLSGYILSTTDNPPFQQSAAVLPWVAAAAEALAQSPGPFPAASLGVWLGFTAWGGDIQATGLQMILAGAVVVLRGKSRLPGRLAWYLGSLLLAMALTAPLLGPIWSTARESGRLGGLPLSIATTWSLHPIRALELLIGPLHIPGQLEALGPELTRYLGNSPHGDRSVEGLWSVSEHLGAVPLALALIALLGKARGRTAAIYVGVALLALLLALGPSAGLYSLAWRFLPGWASYRYPEKLMPFALMGLAALASLGVGELSPRPRVFAVLLGATALLGVFAVAGDQIATTRLLGPHGGFSGGESAEALGVIRLALQTRAAVAAALLLGLTAVLRFRPETAGWAAVALGAAQSAWCAQGVLGIADRAVLDVAPPLREFIAASPNAAAGRLCSWPATYEFLKSVQLPRGQARLLGDIGAMVPAHSARFGLANITPYGPGLAGALVAACGYQPPCGSECARRLGARWTIVRGSEAHALRAKDGLLGLARCHAPILELFEDRRARPLVSAPEIQFLPDAAVIRRALPNTAATTSLMVGQGPATQAEVRQLTWARPSPARIEVNADLATSGILVISEQCSSGWRATLDGREIPLEHADLDLCAVRGPSGSHHFILQYTPSGWPWAFIPYAFGLASLAYVALRAVSGARGAGPASAVALPER